MKTVNIHEGIFCLNGIKKLLICADYPYYRDKKENWEDRLKKLKEANIEVITFYVPWRHHNINSGSNAIVDFEGKTQGNRDVKHFIELCKSLDLFTILKPGPFIHAEVNYGGLPDFVNPDENPDMEHMFNINGEKKIYGKPLPAPHQANFKSLAREWLSLVYNELIMPNMYPNGNVIAIQVFNEGMYSDANVSPSDYDYSLSGIKKYQEELEKKYHTIEEYNKLNATEYDHFSDICPPKAWGNPDNLGEIIKYMDWCEYQAEYLKQLYSEYGKCFGNSIPLLSNMNAPMQNENGLDCWLARVNPEKLNCIAYGFTCWIGVVSHDEKSYNQFLTLAKRRRGPNLEGNWGFSKLYDHRFKYPIVPYYQTILAIACGATGYNVYTGVGTAHWDEGLDNVYEHPYPDCSPIDHDGNITSKYKILQLLNEYISAYGKEILESCTSTLITYGLYVPYSYFSSWKIEKDCLMKFGLNIPYCGINGLDAFQNNVRDQNYDFQITNLQKASTEDLLKYPLLTLVGGFFMEESVQRKLVDYVRRGGNLILIGDVPQYNEKFETCTLLKEAIFNHSIGRKLENVKVDNLGEELISTHILSNIDGIVLYTVNSNPIAYKKSAGHGEAYFVSGNIFEKNYSEIFTKLINDIIKDYDIITQDKQTQVWCYKCKDDIKHVFVISRSNMAMWHVIKLKNKSGEYDELKVRLPAKSAAIIRLDKQQLTSYLAKGINEYDKSYVNIEIEYKSQKYDNEIPCDVLFMYTNGKKIKKVIAEC